jgi:hypothetical protein
VRRKKSTRRSNKREERGFKAFFGTKESFSDARENEFDPHENEIGSREKSFDPRENYSDLSGNNFAPREHAFDRAQQ